MQSKATTVAAYLSELPADRRAALEAVRKVILANLDDEFAEGMGYGMIGYCVPHSVYPAGYHCNPQQPLPFAGLASQKNHMSVYLMCLYGNPEEEALFRAQWAKSGKKLDMGKCCIRFKRPEDLALDVLGKAVERVTAKKYIARYETTLASAGIRHPGIKAKPAGDGADRKASPRVVPTGARSKTGAAKRTRPAKPVERKSRR